MLHEGYVTHTLEHEAAAWQWAKDNALEWTEPMEARMRYCLGTYVKWGNGGLRSRNPKGYGLSLITLAAGQLNEFLSEREYLARGKRLETHCHACQYCEERFRSAAALTVHVNDKHAEANHHIASRPVSTTNQENQSTTEVHHGKNH